MTTERTPIQKLPVTHVRMRPDLRDWLRERAIAEHRSMASQLIVELETRRRQTEQEQHA